MKKVENGVYEHNQDGFKFICSKNSDDYTIKVWDNYFNKYIKCGTGVSIASCKRRIADYIAWVKKDATV